MAGFDHALHQGEVSIRDEAQAHISGSTPPVLLPALVAGLPGRKISRSFSSSQANYRSRTAWLKVRVTGSFRMRDPRNLLIIVFINSVLKGKSGITKHRGICPESAIGIHQPRVDAFRMSAITLYNCTRQTHSHDLQHWQRFSMRSFACSALGSGVSGGGALY